MLSRHYELGIQKSRHNVIKAFRNLGIMLSSHSWTRHSGTRHNVTEPFLSSTYFPIFLKGCKKTKFLLILAWEGFTNHWAEYRCILINQSTCISRGYCIYCAHYCLHKNSPQWVQWFREGGGARLVLSLCNYGKQIYFISWSPLCSLHKRWGIEHLQTIRIGRSNANKCQWWFHTICSL